MAVAIITFTLLAALRAAAVGTQSADATRMRMAARWEAQNLLVEHQVLGAWPDPGIVRGTARQAGIEFVWQREVANLRDPMFRRIDIEIYPASDPTRVLTRITGTLSLEQGVMQ